MLSALIGAWICLGKAPHVHVVIHRLSQTKSSSQRVRVCVCLRATSSSSLKPRSGTPCSDHFPLEVFLLFVSCPLYFVHGKKSLPDLIPYRGN